MNALERNLVSMAVWRPPGRRHFHDLPTQVVKCPLLQDIFEQSTRSDKHSSHFSLVPLLPRRLPISITEESCHRKTVQMSLKMNTGHLPCPHLADIHVQADVTLELLTVELGMYAETASLVSPAMHSSEHVLLPFVQLMLSLCDSVVSRNVVAVFCAA